jgi:hypothetical protein
LPVAKSLHEFPLRKTRTSSGHDATRTHTRTHTRGAQCMPRRGVPSPVAESECSRPVTDGRSDGRTGCAPPSSPSSLVPERVRGSRCLLTLTHRRLGVGPLAGKMRSELFLCTDHKTLRITERITRLLCPSSEPGPRHPPQQVADRQTDGQTGGCRHRHHHHSLRLRVCVCVSVRACVRGTGPAHDRTHHVTSHTSHHHLSGSPIWPSSASSDALLCCCRLPRGTAAVGIPSVAGFFTHHPFGRLPAFSIAIINTHHPFGRLPTFSPLPSSTLTTLSGGFPHSPHCHHHTHHPFGRLPLRCWL